MILITITSNLIDYAQNGFFSHNKVFLRVVNIVKGWKGQKTANTNISSFLLGKVLNLVFVLDSKKTEKHIFIFLHIFLTGEICPENLL